MKCGDTRTETRFRLSAKRTSPFKTAGASVQSTIGSRGMRISGSNARYTMFRGSVKGTGYPLHSPVSPSLPLPCVTVCHHFSTGVYTNTLINDKINLIIIIYNLTAGYLIIYHKNHVSRVHTVAAVTIYGTRSVISHDEHLALLHCYFPMYVCSAKYG